MAIWNDRATINTKLVNNTILDELFVPSPSENKYIATQQFCNAMKKSHMMGCLVRISLSSQV